LDANPYARFLEGRDPLKVIAATPARIRTLVRELTPRQLTRPPAPGKWSLHEIVIHLAETDMVMLCRDRWIAFEDNPTLLPFDQDKWAAGWEREKESFDETLERLTLIRRSHVRLFKSATAKDLRRSGYHPERGKITLRIQLETVAGHDLNHLLQIETLAAGFRKRALK
jgi:hypothetical protein